MTFFRFKSDDIINTKIIAYPQAKTSLNGDQMTGSVFLEQNSLDTSLRTRRFQGYSEKLGGFIEKNAPFSSSIEFLNAIQGSTNFQLYETILTLYSYHSILNSNYTASYNNSHCTNFRVITIPEIYYDREILTGSFSASDNGFGGRNLFDDGRGGIYSGSLSGTLVGNIFYPEGIIVLKKPDLVDFALSASMTGNAKWNISFRGTHTIPVKIFKCRAPAGELNCSTNTTYFGMDNSLSSSNRDENEILMPNNITYITKVGLYDDDYKLVAIATLGHPIRKNEEADLIFKLRMDW